VGRIFKDEMTTAAAIDRLVHHATIVEMTNKSVRAEQASEALRTVSKTATTTPTTTTPTTTTPTTTTPTTTTPEKERQNSSTTAAQDGEV
jgi:uncharacterized membrane protein (UPF0182 family)